MPHLFVDDIVVSENGGFATLKLRLSEPATSALGVNWTTVNGTAVASLSADFVGASGTVTFAIGETEKTISVALTNDLIAERNEWFWVNLTPAAGSTLTLESSRVLIDVLDNDTPAAVPVVSIGDAFVDELSGTASFVVSLDRVAASTVSVEYTTGDLTAQSGSDYSAIAGTLNFPAGTRVQTITVPIVNDGSAEGSEAFQVTLSSPAGVTIGNAVGTGVIGPSDAPAVLKPTLWVSDAVAGEGEPFVEFHLWLDAPSTAPVTVNYGLQSGSAVASLNSDFGAVNAQVTFAPGQMLQTVRVPLTNDDTAELPEAFWMNLSVAAGSSVTLGRSEAIAVIVDNDQASGVPIVSVSVDAVDEAAGIAVFVVALDRPATSTVQVPWTTVDGSAGGGADFVALSGTLGFAPGETLGRIIVPLIDDAVAEPAEQFRVQLGAPSGATLGVDWAAATIGANDAPALLKPTLYADDVTLSEADGLAELVLRLDAPSAGSITVNFGAQSGNAVGSLNSDFIGVSGFVTFAPGQTVQAVKIPITNDTTPENTEVFWINLNAAAGSSPVAFARSEVPVIIVDNDTNLVQGTPIASVGDVFVDEASSGFARFVVTLDRPAAGIVTVDYEAVGANATAGDDFSAVTGTLVFAPGDTVQTVEVPILDDSLPETDEQFRLVLSDPAGADLGQATGVATIGANDAPALLKPTLYADGVTVSEADGVAELVLRLDAPSAGPITVNYGGQSGSAVATLSSDFVGINGSVTFAPGQTLQTLKVPITNDTTPESTEAFWIVMSVAAGSSPVALARNEIPIVVVDNDANLVQGTPHVSARGLFIDESAGYATFAVVLDRPSSGPASVQYATADAAAVAGEDYLATSGTLFFEPGETAKTVRVPLVDDLVPEGFEPFELRLSNPTGLELAGAKARAIIGFSDQPAQLKPQLFVSDPVVGEIDGMAKFVLWMDAPSNSPITINYGTASGTAATADFVAVGGSVTFAPGTTTHTIAVPIKEDLLVEGDETFRLNLAAAAGTNVTLVRTQATATIVDNDSNVIAGTPAITVGDVVVNEHRTLTSFAVTLDRASTDVVSVDYATANGDALAGQDYRGDSGTLTFLPGETAKRVQVSIVDDNTQEPDEQFSLVLSAPVGATLAKPSATATIVSDDVGKPALVGTAGPDTLVDGIAGPVFVDALAGDDTITGGDGDDTIDGGAGTDTATWSGNAGNYALSFSGAQMQVHDTVGGDGTDTLTGVERLQFSDGSVIVDSATPAWSYTGLPEGLYHFFIVAFDAAPGVTYMDQLAQAWNYYQPLYGSDALRTIVNIFTTKSQFTDVYPLSLSNEALATELVNRIVKGSATDASRAEAIGDVKGALDLGWTRGDVIYTVFGNLGSKPPTDPQWGDTARQFANEIEVAKYYTEVLHQSTTDLPTLRDVIAPVDQDTDVSTPETIATLIGVALMDGAA